VLQPEQVGIKAQVRISTSFGKPPARPCPKGTKSIHLRKDPKGKGNLMKFASLALALLVVPMAGTAQQPNEIPTNLAGISTIAPPPDGFDPLTATDADLAYYGFPPRPNENSGDYASWAKAMTASAERIVPTLVETNISHGPRVNAPGSTTDTDYSYNWSGYVKNGSAKSYGKSSYSFVYSDVTVPTAQQASGKCTGGWDYGSAWVGIDGDGSNDVLQDGIEFDAYCKGSTKDSYYSPWFEWYPFNEVRISGLPISAGNEYYMEVWSTSSTKGHAYLVNVTKKKSVTINFSAPSGTKLIGNSAEWITERPGVNGSLATLTNYGSQTYSDSLGETFAGSSVDPGNSTPIIMLDNNGKAISYPTKKSSKSFVMKVEGSAK
jgi:hypothetical protein